MAPNIAVGCDTLKNKVWVPPKLGVEIMDNLEMVEYVHPNINIE